MASDSSKFVTLQALVLDVDGVLTDGRMYWSASSNEEFKSFGRADLVGLTLLRRLGIQVALISSEPDPLVDRYAEKLNVSFVAKGTRDKAAAVLEFAAKYAMDLAHTGYMGDDVSDLFGMDLVGLSACPSNAAVEVRKYVHINKGFISGCAGGHGAVRELADVILSARRLRGRDVYLLRSPE